MIFKVIYVAIYQRRYTMNKLIICILLSVGLCYSPFATADSTAVAAYMIYKHHKEKQEKKEEQEKREKAKREEKKNEEQKKYYSDDDEECEDDDECEEE